MTDLKVSLLGHTLKNPIIPASGTFGFGYEFAEWYDINCLGSISLKGTTLSERYGNPLPRVAECPSGMLNAIGLQNKGVDKVISEEIEKLKAVYSDKVIANVGGHSEEEYISVCEKFDGCDKVFAIELNISCPNVKGGGMAFGVDASVASNLVAKIKKRVKKPIMVKLSPNVTSISEMAKAVEGAGADAVSLINTLVGMRIDIATAKPVLATGSGGYSGKGVFPVALKMIYDVKKAVSIPVVGMGGVSSYDDARRMIEAGADSVGVGSALSRVMPSDYENFFHALKTGGDTSPYLSSGNAMEYTPHKVLTKEMHGDDVMVITVSGEVGCNPGEFVFIWVPGMGEKPFSVAVNKPLTFLIKKRGIFTSAFFGIEPGDTIYTRGLYGRPMVYEKTERALLIGGGTGAAVLPLIAEKLSADGTRMDIRVGVVRKEGKDPLEDVLSSYGSYMSVPDDGKPGRVLDSIVPSDLAGDTALYVVGPGKMMEKAAEKAEAMGFPADRIYLSMEKNTMCGIGMCGECVCGGHLPCKEGTFFTWKTLKENGAVL